MGDTQPTSGVLHPPEAAKGSRSDASFTGSRCDVSGGNIASISQPHGSYAIAGSRRTADEMLTALRKGTDLLKHGRQGKPKMHFFRLAEGDSLLTWRSANGKPRGISLVSVKQVIKGQVTETFKRYPLPHMAHASFSLLYVDLDSTSRTLDLTCRTEQEFELWYWGLQAVTDRLRATATSQKVVVGSPTGEVMPSAKSLLQLPVGSQNPSSTTKVVGGGTVLGRVTGAMGLPVPEQRPGDCYVWGSPDPYSSLALVQGSTSDRQQSALPAIVNDSTHLDVCQVAAGLRHAALLTRSGEVYTWGNGTGGKLGLGHAVDACSPQRVHTLWGQHIKSIVAGDACTAAVSEEGSLYTWGDGAAGNLGYSDALRQFIPRRVEGALLDHVITQVSCGPYHSAALSSTGALFTWGDGLCGKLGHGTLDSCPEPRQVEALKDKRVIHVACGVWHTAAIAAEPIGGSSLPTTSLSDLSYQEGETLRQTLSAAYSMLDEEGGALFTWGGQFTWVEHKKDSAGHVVDKKDHHRGCLGHGDTAGRLVPTRVKGALEGLAVRQVECGLNLTVALTTDGRTWQMGETGTPAHKLAPWEGAREPQQVPLPGHFVERIAVGMQHVAALAGPLDGHTGRAEEGEECSVIFTWGRGREGQLGMGLHADSAVPAPVDELRGRHVLQVACGGCYTLAVCRHDADKEDTEERRRGYKGKMRAWFSNNNCPLVAVPEKPEVHPLKFPRDSGGTPFAEDRPASTSGSLASFTAPSEPSTPRSVRAGIQKGAQRRATLAANARAFSTSLAQQLRRHSGDAYAASQRFLAGAKSTVPSQSDASGPRRATSPEMEAASHVPLAETSVSLPEPLTSVAAPVPSSYEAQPAPYAQDSAEQVPRSSKNAQTYIAELEARVAQLEALLAQSSTAAQPGHSSSSASPEPLPSPFRAALPNILRSRSMRRHSSATPSSGTNSGEGSRPSVPPEEPAGSEQGSTQGPIVEETPVSPPPRMLQLSLGLAPSLSPQHHRRSYSLADWSASAAPLWQPQPEQAPSPTTRDMPLIVDPSPARHAQLSSPDTTTSGSAQSHAQGQLRKEVHIQDAAAGDARFGDVGFFGRPHSPVLRTSTIDVGALMGGSGSPRWHLGSYSPRSRLRAPGSPSSHASADEGPGTSGGAHSRLGRWNPATSGGFFEGSGPREEEGVWMLQQAAEMQRQVQRERAELEQMRAQLEARDAQEATRARELQLADAQSQTSLSRESTADSPVTAAAAASAEPLLLPQPGHEQTVEVSEGVFLTLEATPSGQNVLTRIRFARGRFSKAQAEAWWRAHKADVALRCNLAPRSPRPAPDSAASTPRAADTREFGTPYHSAPSSPFSRNPQAGGSVSLPHLGAPLSPASPSYSWCSSPLVNQQDAQQCQNEQTPAQQPYGGAHEEQFGQDGASSASQLPELGEKSTQMTPRELSNAAVVPPHSASAYAHDSAAADLSHTGSLVSSAGLSLPGSGAEGCGTEPFSSAAEGSHAADQPESAVAAESSTQGASSQLTANALACNLQAADAEHSRAGSRAAVSTAEAFWAAPACKASVGMALIAVSGASATRESGTGDFMQLDLGGLKCSEGAQQLSPASLDTARAIAAL